jgi:membrane-bound metal-dependent hydrolase YbcI (DUF457 family)
MDFFTHLVVGIAGGRLLSKNPNYQKAFILGSISPDFDIFLAWLPALISELVMLSHRGLFHTLFFLPFVIPILIYGTSYLSNIKRFNRLETLLQETKISLTKWTWLIGISGSYLHLGMDTINPQGTILLFPISTERISLSTMSFFDPIITILAGAFFFWFLYKKVYKKHVISTKFIDRYTRTVTILFFVVLSSYAFMQINTVNNYQPETSTIGFFTFQRWIIEDQNEELKVQLVNQLTQQVERTFIYQKMTWDNSKWSESEIGSAISTAEKTQKYYNYLFTLNPDTRLVYKVTSNLDNNKWIVEIIDVFEDVQSKYWGFESNPFSSPSIAVEIPF